MNNRYTPKKKTVVKFKVILVQIIFTQIRMGCLVYSSKFVVKCDAYNFKCVRHLLELFHTQIFRSICTLKLFASFGFYVRVARTCLIMQKFMNQCFFFHMKEYRIVQWNWVFTSLFSFRTLSNSLVTSRLFSIFYFKLISN